MDLVGLSAVGILVLVVLLPVAERYRRWRARCAAQQLRVARETVDRLRAREQLMR